MLATVLSAVTGRVIASLECEDKQISLSAKLVPSTTYPLLLWKDPSDRLPALKTTPKYDCSYSDSFYSHTLLSSQDSWGEGVVSTTQVFRFEGNAKANWFKNSEHTGKLGREGQKHTVVL